MSATSFEKQRLASKVIQVGDLPTPEVGTRKICVRLCYSTKNPSGTKRPTGFGDQVHTFPKIVPHSDVAAEITATTDYHRGKL